MIFSKHRIRYIGATLFLSLLLISSLTAQIEGLRAERIDNYVKKEIEKGKIPGAVTMISKSGKVIYSSAHGYRDLANKEKMETTDLFFIQSMTKPIITAAFMTLYEEGHFQLSDKVSRYLPEFSNLKVSTDISQGKEGPTEDLETDITIAHLLSHTAGFSHGLGGSKLDREVSMGQYRQPHESVQDRVDNLLTFPLVGQPGEQWYYSAAPDVISVLIEHFSGKPTNEFLQERIFDPLGMEDTGYNLTKSQENRRVSLHAIDEDGNLVKTEYQTPTNGNKIWSGVNGLFSTAQDYLKFAQMMMQGGTLNGKRILSRKTVEIMTIDQIGGIYQKPGEVFGLGFAIVTDLGKTKGSGSEGMFYWGGAFNTHFFIDPKEQVVAIFMTQTAVYDDNFHRMLRQMVYQGIE